MAHNAPAPQMNTPQTDKGGTAATAKVIAPAAPAAPALPAKPQAPAGTSAPATIRNVKVSHEPGALDVVIEGPSSAHSFLLKDPDRLVLDFSNTLLNPSVRNIAVRTKEVLDVRVGRFQSNPPVARVVIDLSGPLAFDVLPSDHQVTVRVKIGEAAASSPRSAATAPPSSELHMLEVRPNPAAVQPNSGSNSPTAHPAPSGASPAPHAVLVSAPVVSNVSAPAAGSAAASTPKAQSAAPATASPKPAPPVETARVAPPAPVVAPSTAIVVAHVTAPVTTSVDSPSASSASKPSAPPATAPKAQTATPAPAPPPSTPPVVEIARAAPPAPPAATAPAPIVAPPRPLPRQSFRRLSLPRPPSHRLSLAAPAPIAAPAAPKAPSEIAAAAPPKLTPPVVADAHPLPPSMQQSSATNAPPAPPASKYTGEPISVNLKDVDLKDFFRLIHEISGLNVVLDPSVHGSVTLVLDDVPWDQALDIVLKNNGLDRELQGNVLRIAATDTLRREAVDRRAQSEAIALAVDRQTITRFLSYGKAKEIVPTIKRFLTSRGDVIADERTNALIISDIPSVLPTLDRLISQLDKKSQEVEIEVRVVSATRSFSRDLGVQLGFNWGNGVTTIGGSNPNGSTITTPSGTASSVPLFSNFPATGPTTGLSFSNITASYGIDAILTAAESHNLAKVLSRPRVVTQSNIKAEVKQGVKLPVITAATANANATTSYIDSVLRLSVTPQITADNTIFLTVDVENTQPQGTANSEGNYVLTTQQTTTQVLVTDGGTVVIGGIIQTTNSVSTTQTPVLGNIPWLGNLFKERLVKTETDELIFFITPKIIQT